MNENLSIEERFEDAREILKILDRVMGFGGIWPLTKSHFYLSWVVPYIINIVGGILYFIQFHNTLPLFANNMSEVLLNITVTGKVLIIRHSTPIAKVVMAVNNNMASVRFNSDEEREIYLQYAMRGKGMCIFTIKFIFGAAMGFYLRPLGILAGSALINSSNIIYELPYPIEIYVDYTDVKMFVLIYIAESPHAIMNSFFGVCLAMDYVICFHCCGELAVLQYRIRRMGMNEAAAVDPDKKYKELVEYHVQTITLVKDVDAALQIILLQEVMGMTGILALTTYTIMMNLTDLAICISYGIFATAALGIVYSHCLISENLIIESLNVSEAYYESKWQNLPANHQRLLTICIAGSNKALCLTGGGFYIYSMASFAAVLKTAMAYLSMLRSVS